MNYDRFLTRVFDKQEKKMIYPIGCWDLNEHRSLLLEDGQRVEAICLCPHTQELTYNKVDHDGDHLDHIEFGDRFVPMMCTGSCDKNNKLFYGEDIMKDREGRLGRIQFHDELGYFTVKFKDDMFVCPSKSLFAICELVGNRWENEKLMEVKA